MTQTSTSKLNDVVKYLYNETHGSETTHIEKTLTEDIHLLDFYLDCQWIKKEMDKISMEPSEKAIKNILAFSKKYQPVH